MSEKWTTRFGEYGARIDATWQKLVEDRAIERIWQHDHTVWKDDPEEITNRLGWLDIANRLKEAVSSLEELRDSLQADGYTNALLLGMGGSSLAPEVFSKIFADATGLDLEIVDTTDPDYILGLQEGISAESTVSIVATKSGGTVETLSAFKHFYNWTADQLGSDAAGSHFIAITDPGSKLVKLGNEFAFRHIFENDPNIGGRYSVLSYFGMVPAALVGIDVAKLLDRAIAIAHAPIGGKLGAALGALAGIGRDKLTLVGSTEIIPFFDWVEQLVAESTGKDGKGILPVVGEPLAAPDAYGDDRVFVSLELAGDKSTHAALDSLAEAGHPVIQLELADLYDLGEQFFLWEMATAVAGSVMEIHPFDQPNVESAKVRAREMIDEYQAKGELPTGETAQLSAETLQNFLAQAKTGDYIAVMSYVEPTAATSAAMATLQAKLRDMTKLATTVNYGPRFLHSTGQLHKGDGGSGLFIQFTSDSTADLPIPDNAGSDESAMSFQPLKLAQALGDAEALRGEDRRLIRFHIKDDPASVIAQLASELE